MKQGILIAATELAVKKHTALVDVQRVNENLATGKR